VQLKEFFRFSKDCSKCRPHFLEILDTQDEEGEKLRLLSSVACDYFSDITVPILLGD